MSSNSNSKTKLKSSRGNGVSPQAPQTPTFPRDCSQDAMRCGLLANTILLKAESEENFMLVMQMHIDRFQPADGVEFGMIEEMGAAYWRLHRNMAIETRTLENQVEIQPVGNPLTRLANASDSLAASPGTSQIHRQEARLQLIYQRAIRTLALMRTLDRPIRNQPNQLIPNQPSPISEHSIPDRTEAGQQSPPSPQTTDSESLASACFSLRDWSLPSPRPPHTAPASAPAKPAAPPPHKTKSGGAA